MARARGLSGRDPGEDYEGEGDVERDPDERSAPGWPDPRSGCPSSLAETIFILLLAGFRPESLPTLRKKLLSFLKSTLGHAASDFKSDVPKSLSAMIVSGSYFY